MLLSCLGTPIISSSKALAHTGASYGGMLGIQAENLACQQLPREVKPFQPLLAASPHFVVTARVNHVSWL